MRNSKVFCTADLTMGVVYRALCTRLRSLTTGQRASNEEQQDDTELPPPENIPLELESSRFHDGPSHSIDASGALLPSDAHTLRPPRELGSTPEVWHSVSMSDSSSECAAASSGMDSVHESCDEGLPVSSAAQSSLDSPNQVHRLSLYHLLYEILSVVFAFLLGRLSTHPTSTDATLSSEGTLVQPSTYLEENNGNQNQFDVLQKLAANRMAVMGLRSNAQEQSKAIRRLYIQVFDDVSSVVAVLKEHTPGQVATESGQLSDRIDAISSQLRSIEEARKVFHKSQERLLSVEWKMMEGENNLYPEYQGKESPHISEDDTSDNISNLASIPIPSSSDEEQPVQALESPALSPVQYEDLRDALTEAVVSGAGTLSNEQIEPIQLRLEQKLDGELLNLERSDMRDISLTLSTAAGQVAPASTAPGRISLFIGTPAEMRPRNYVTRQELCCIGIGSQFSDISEYIPSAKQDGENETPLTSEDVPTATYTVSGISRWLAYGSPWSSFATDRQHHSYHLPGGMSTLQGIMIKNYESVVLGLPMSEQLHYMTDLVDEEFNTPRSLLLHNWLWDPVSRFDRASFVMPAASQTDGQMRGLELERLARNTLEKNSEFNGARNLQITTSLPVTARSIDTVRSNAAVSRSSSRARSLP